MIFTFRDLANEELSRCFTLHGLLAANGADLEPDQIYQYECKKIVFEKRQLKASAEMYLSGTYHPQQQ